MQRRDSPYPPIGDYAFLSDSETTALVAPNGNVEWLCVPRMDSPSVFAAILDRRAGGFRLGPTDAEAPTGRRYLPGTLILETTWMTATGWLLVEDCLAVGPWRMEDEPAPPYRRTPRDRRAEHVLVRTVRCLHGVVDVVLDCHPLPDYARAPATWTADAQGRARLGGDPALALVTDLPVNLAGHRLQARTTLQEGESAFAALSWGGRRAPPDVAGARERIEETASYWREWLGGGRFPDHPWRAHLQRSALVLKGLTYAPTGGLVAAATTSLPEELGGERNWDYRYTWIRDATFMLWGLYTLGLDVEADDFFTFVAERCAEDRRLQIMYGIDGERVLEEESLDHLHGYCGSRPVRIGNQAYRQAQHDAWGALLDSIYLHTRSDQHLPRWLWPVVERQVDDALAHWRDPDHGIWEVRGEPRHFTASKVLCWVAADRGARLARFSGEDACAERWRAAAAEIHAEVCERGVDERGVFTQHYDTRTLDGANLLIPLVRFLPAHDDRIRATVNAIADELTEDDLVFRYRVGETDDGVSGGEGAFVICSFWLVSALVEIGQAERGRELCDKLLSYAGSLELYAEQLEPHTGRQLGNFPQAFSHLALVNAVLHVIRAEEGQDPGRFARVGGAA